MNTKTKTLLIAPLALAVSLSTQSAFAELSGNIGVHSKYQLRGIAPENDAATVQGGLDYSSGGLYVGYWFSSLGYGNAGAGNGFENDIYGGYVFDISDSISVDVGLTQYYYVNVDDSDLTEANLSVSLGDFYAKMQYLLNDGAWGTSGDIYWTAGASFSLPKDIGLSLDVGYYTYNDEDTTKYLAKATSSGGFRNFTTTISYPVGKTGAEAYIQYIVAGEDRNGVDTYEDQVVAGFTYSFDM